MKLLGITLLTLTALFALGCGSQQATKDLNVNTNQSPAGPGVAKFKADFKTSPSEVKAGEPVELSFTVKNDKGEIVKDLPIVHEMPLHLLVVSDDLAEYYHLHPELQPDGSYSTNFTFQNGGNFRLYADYTPKDSPQIVENFTLKVSGNERARVELKADDKFERTVDGLRFVMKPDSDLVAGKELMLNFNVSDEKTNKPVTDLEKYLGEYAHFVIISQDLTKFVHAHPMSKEENDTSDHDMGNMKGMDGKTDESKPHSHGDSPASTGETKPSPSEVSAHTSFPQAGLFKVFAQFKRGGKVITVPFTVNIQEGNTAAKPIADVQFPADAKKVIVSKNGYEPNTVTFAKGESVKLAFYRADSENCGGEIVFKAANISKKLPVGEVVVVDLSEVKGSEFSFACGMGMLSGKVVVSGT